MARSFMPLLLSVIARYRIPCTYFFFFFSSRRRHTRFDCDWSSDVCSSDLNNAARAQALRHGIQVQRRDDRIADHEHVARRHVLPEQLPPTEQPFADQNRIAATA